MKHLSVNGIELATVDRGSGSPLVLVHGFPLNHAMWNAQIEALSTRHRVIVPDLRGFGASGVTEGTVTMEQFADDLAALLDGLGVDEPVALGGLSMGGYIAWAFWRKYPARVQALILCDTRAAADAPEVAANRLATAERVLREGPGPLAEGMLPKLTAASTPNMRPEAIETLRQMILATNPQGIAAASRGMAARPDVTPWLSQITCRTLVVVGQEDTISPVAEMQTIATAIPGAQLVEIRGAGHMSPLENPLEVNAAIGAFLAEGE